MSNALSLSTRNQLILRGMTSVAVAAFEAASVAANIDIFSRTDARVVQALGDAAASKGYHHQDGVLDGHPYTAAADLSVRGLNHVQIATWLEELCSQGFAAFYRNWPGNLHIHGNFCGVPQKRELDQQDIDFFNGHDGLVGHHRIDDEWWYPELERRAIPEAMFKLSNPASGPGQVVTRADVIKQSVPPSPPLGYSLYLNAETKPRLTMPVIDGVAYASVRNWAAIMGFDLSYNPTTQTVQFDGNDQPIALKLMSGVGYAPIRQLVREAGLRVVAVDALQKRVMVARA